MKTRFLRSDGILLLLTEDLKENWSSLKTLSADLWWLSVWDWLWALVPSPWHPPIRECLGVPHPCPPLLSWALANSQLVYRSPSSLTVWRTLFFTLGLKDTAPGRGGPGCALSHLPSKSLPASSFILQTVAACLAGHCGGTWVLVLINPKVQLER